MIDWHRLFGLTLTDFFTGSAYRVEMETDLSIKQQLLDILIIEQEEGSPVTQPPAGLDNLSRHNLMTYKSLHQPLDAWALDELVGHYVNYRKQRSPSFDALLPVEDFSLYAVTTRRPAKLEIEASLTQLEEGVYEARWGSRPIRIIVLSRIPQTEQNAVWQLFSGIRENVLYGASHYHWRSNDLSTVRNQLFQSYDMEGLDMAYTVEDYKREQRELREEIRREILAELTIEEILETLPPEERMKGLPPEERLKGLPPEERLKGLPPEELLKGLSPEEILKALPPEERLKDLSPEELLKRLNREDIEAYLKKLSTVH